MEPLLEDGELSAQITPEHPGSPTPSQMCLIVIGGEYFAVDLRSVCGVFEVDSITPVPGIPTSLVGVANLRGSVVPIADLRPSMRVPASTVPEYVLVVHHDAQQVGLLIDDVPTIVPVHSDDILAASNSSVNDDRPFLSGLLNVENCLSGILEVPRFMASIEGINKCDARKMEADSNHSSDVSAT